MSKQIALFIPCYNEEKRLKIEEIKEFIVNNNNNIDFIFIDDGSSDSTSLLLQANLIDEKHVFLIRLKRNMGKGNAIRESLLQYLHKPYNYYGFIDADLDIPFQQVLNLHNELINTSYMVAISQRDLVKNVSFTRLRSVGSMIMLMIANKIIAFKPILNDSQCGCKLFKKEVVEICFKDKFISNWLFDIEIFLRLKEKLEEPRNIICEVPLLNVGSSESSRFEFRKNLKIIGQLYRIRNHYK